MSPEVTSTLASTRPGGHHPAAPTAPQATNVLKIGGLAVWPPVVLAPMAGVTNAPFRTLCRSFGAGLYVSEMITARAYLERNDKTMRLASFAADESPRSIQLYGTNATDMGAAAARLVSEGRVDHIDLNFGCPARKVTRNGGGAALPVRRRLLGDILAAVVHAAGAVPVTAKFRLGVDDEHLTYLDTGRMAEDAGCAAIGLHARTAEQLYSGHSNWEAIATLKDAVRTIPVLGNGDIWEASDAAAMLSETGCDGVIVGRGCLGRPWLFGDLADLFDGRPVGDPPPLGEVVDLMIRHLDLLIDWSDHDLAVREFRKHTGWYLKGYPVGNELRVALARLSSRAQLQELTAPLDPAITMADNGRRAVRGHHGGPRPVSLPDGWYDSADSLEPLAEASGAAVSGG